MAEAETRKWKESVLKEQQMYYEMLGDRDWDCYKELEMEFLERNVGHAVFGPPEQLPDKKENGNTGYTADKLEVIRQVICVIKKHSKYPSCNGSSSDVWVSVVFVCLNIDNKSISVPVFRIPHHQPQLIIPLKNRFSFYYSNKHKQCKLFKAKLRSKTWLIKNVKTGIKFTVESKSSCWFVDTNCRVYEDWEGYLKNNCLPKCTYCYPTGGIYNGDDNDRVIVEFGLTPASNIKNQICNVLDTASTVVTVGGMAVAAAALFTTVAAPLAVATTVGTVATGVYGIGRSAAALKDRGNHKQSVGLEDAESRSCWLSVAGNSLGIASSQAIRSVTKLTQQGKVLSSAGRLLVNAINFSSLTVNGLGLLNNFVTLQEKAKKNELKPLEVFQFASSVLFFTMSAVNMKTANALIRETQDSVLGDYEASLRSNRHRRQFRRLVKETQGEEGNSMHANARVIRGITQISDRDNFFAGLVRVQKQLAKNNAKVILTDAGLVEINGELSLHPMKFWEIDKLQRNFILDATKNLNQGLWTQERFNQEMQSVCQEQNLMFRSQQNETMTNMNQRYRSDMEMSLQVNQVTMSRKLFQFAREHRQQILNIARNLAEMMGFHNAAEIIKVADFLANYVEQVTAEVEAKYQQDLSAAQTAQGENFNRENFDVEYNIQGNRSDHFIKTVLTSYNTYEALIYLKGTFHNLTDANNEMPGTSRPNMESAELTECVKHFTIQHRKNIISIAINLCDILGLRSSAELIEITNFVASYIENVLSEMEVKYEESLNKTMKQEGQNFNRRQYNIDGDRREHFIKNVINKYDDYEQLKQLKTAYQESRSQNKDKPKSMQSDYTEERDFEMQGDLSDEEMYKIAQDVTGLYLFAGNATLMRDGPVSFVTITDPHIEPVTIIINSDMDNNIINASMVT